MIKRVFFILFFLSILSPVFAQENIPDFSEGSIPPLHEEFRKIRKNIESVEADIDALTFPDEKVKASSGDATADYLDGKVAKSVVVASNKLELSGDAAAPGNSKYYGTDGAGTKGFNALPTYNETTQENGTFTNVQFSTTGDTTLVTVNKTITSGRTVLILASGSGSGDTAGLGCSIKSKYGGTLSQTIAFGWGAASESHAFALCSIVTGLSGAVAFTLTGTSDSSGKVVTVSGNLIVLEL